MRTGYIRVSLHPRSPVKQSPNGWWTWRVPVSSGKPIAHLMPAISRLLLVKTRCGRGVTPAFATMETERSHRCANCLESLRARNGQK